MFMLAGPNGAGKSTLYETAIRPRLTASFINAESSAIERFERNQPLIRQAVLLADQGVRLAAVRRDVQSRVVIAARLYGLKLSRFQSADGAPA